MVVPSGTAAALPFIHATRNTISVWLRVLHWRIFGGPQSSLAAIRARAARQPWKRAYRAGEGAWRHALESGLPVAECDTGRMSVMKAKSPVSEPWLVLRECLQ